MESFDKNSVKICDKKPFTFPHIVFPPEASQKEVFDKLMPELLDNFLSGYDVNILAYGQVSILLCILLFEWF